MAAGNNNIAQSMANALIVTPPVFKHQLINKISAMLDRRENYEYKFNDDVNLDLTFNLVANVPLTTDCVAIRQHGRDLLIIGSDGDNHSANDFYIESLWDLYNACEPIYPARMENYAIAGE